MELTDKHILITGANGFIGSHLVTRLAEREGARVRALVRTLPREVPSKACATRVEFVCGNITDAVSVERAVHECDIIIHTAAQQPFAPLASRAQFHAVNVGGTENLLRAFKPTPGSRFLLLSTINGHGLPPPRGTNAESALAYSGDRYSDSKVAGERSAWRFARERDIPITVIRPACTFGPRSYAWTIQPLERIRRGMPVMLGTGRGICNPIYIDNLVDLIVTSLRRDVAIDQAFIGSDGIGVEWRDFFGCYARMCGRSLRSTPMLVAQSLARASTLLERVTGRPGPVARSSVQFYSHRVTFNVEENSRVLGHSPSVSFAEGMRRTEQWLRAGELI